jgi:hypothetical protein
LPTRRLLARLGRAVYLLTFTAAAGMVGWLLVVLATSAYLQSRPLPDEAALRAPSFPNSGAAPWPVSAVEGDTSPRVVVPGSGIGLTRPTGPDTLWAQPGPQG